MQTKRDNDHAYTIEERHRMLALMQSVATAFYPAAVRTGVHAFIEFCGLMTEFIKVCRDAENEGSDFTMANTHTGVALPFKPYHAEYLAEKLNCIYGPALLSSDENRNAFIEKLFDGQYTLELKPVEPR